MRLSIANASIRRRRIASGFTLVESLFAMAIVGGVFVSLYSGITYGIQRVQFSRENQRATQIMLEKMETIRLYSWHQITATNFVPETFVSYYHPDRQGSGAGAVYRGKVNVATPSLSANYEERIKRITVQLAWTSGNVDRERSISTYVTENGLYSYIY